MIIEIDKKNKGGGLYSIWGKILAPHSRKISG